MQNDIERLQKTLADLESLLDQRAAPEEVRELVARARDEADTLPKESALSAKTKPATVRSVAAVGEADSFASRLSETARQFETSHPRLFTFLGEVADALARIGI